MFDGFYGNCAFYFDIIHIIIEFIRTPKEWHLNCEWFFWLFFSRKIYSKMVFFYLKPINYIKTILTVR